MTTMVLLLTAATPLINSVPLAQSVRLLRSLRGSVSTRQRGCPRVYCCQCSRRYSPKVAVETSTETLSRVTVAEHESSVHSEARVCDGLGLRYVVVVEAPVEAGVDLASTTLECLVRRDEVVEGHSTGAPAVCNDAIDAETVRVEVGTLARWSGVGADDCNLSGTLQR